MMTHSKSKDFCVVTLKEDSVDGSETTFIEQVTKGGGEVVRECKKRKSFDVRMAAEDLEKLDQDTIACIQYLTE
ncbi:uncharacterized protein J8A68_000474 [[Candida] subhashii]|uniref:Uncharacterized protein n=1 Tax=[Candida] subhashii TaxID=561895 RepID=A0A8J5QI36_9ASCO|nr:uncharacterized protein J8A68_000474 [[Candida] subhashii]KAG7666044.1 hypothetical protein J8A68_000474 [[Candida] subhashii]